MRKIISMILVLGLILVVGIGCGKKETAQNSTPQLPSQPNSFGSMGDKAKPAKPVDVKEVTEKVTKALDAKFPGEWKVSGTTLKKGSYTENDNYGIVDEVANVYPGSMISLFVGQDRISSTVKGQDGKRVLAGYPTPETVGKTMESGKASVAAADSMGSTSYQKVFMPLKAGDKTVAVMTISIGQ